MGEIAKRDLREGASLMVAPIQTIDFGYARVHVSFRPTPTDKVGCDGMYIERVEVKPLRQWSVRDWLRYLRDRVRSRLRRRG